MQQFFPFILAHSLHFFSPRQSQWRLYLVDHVPWFLAEPGGKAVAADRFPGGRCLVGKPAGVLVGLQIGFHNRELFGGCPNSLPHELFFFFKLLRFLVEAKGDSRICLRQISTRSFCAFDNSWLWWLWIRTKMVIRKYSSDCHWYIFSLKLLQQIQKA